MNSFYTYNARIIKVIDGDTIDLEVDLGFDITMNMRVRMYGINAPEMNTPAGPLAKQFLQDMLPLDAQVLMHSKKDKTDKYGRYLAIVENDGIVTNDKMVQHGHAVEYMK